MLAPMALLAALCALIGLVPAAWLPTLARAAGEWSGLPAAALAEPIGQATRGAWRISLAALLLLAVTGLLAAWRRARLAGPQPTAPTWACGFATPTSRMQYTGSSFAELLVHRFRWVFFPMMRVVPPAGLFPRGASFDSHVPDTVLDIAIIPLLRSATSWADRLRARVSGRVQTQVLYTVAGLVGLLAWLVLR
jgi:hypothetical protein